MSLDLLKEACNVNPILENRSVRFETWFDDRDERENLLKSINNAMTKKSFAGRHPTVRRLLVAIWAQYYADWSVARVYTPELLEQEVEILRRLDAAGTGAAASLTNSLLGGFYS